MCPNEVCKKNFCWICGDVASEGNDCKDHYSNINMFGCYGDQFKDVRESTVVSVSCQQFIQILMLPICAMFSVVRFTISNTNLNAQANANNKNILIKLLIWIGMYLVFMPVTIVLHMVKTIVLTPFSIIWQVRKLFKYC